MTYKSYQEGVLYLWKINTKMKDGFQILYRLVSSMLLYLQAATIKHVLFGIIKDICLSEAI